MNTATVSIPTPANENFPRLRTWKVVGTAVAVCQCDDDGEETFNSIVRAQTAEQAAEHFKDKMVEHGYYVTGILRQYIIS